MIIKNYFYKTADKFLEDRAYIEDRLKHGDKLMNMVNFSTYLEELEKIKPTGKTAVLYVGGAAQHHSLTRIYKDTIPPLGINPISSQTGFAAQTVAKFFNAEFLSINANTCASSMYCFYEAQRLINEGFDDVIVYGEEWVEDIELLLFKTSNIKVIVSDGFCVIHFQKGEQIQDVSWLFHAEKHPFGVSKDGYMKAMQNFARENIDAVKTHGTKTPQNECEYEAIKEVFGDIELIEYKDEIGHTQGVSTMIETCMLLDRVKDKKVLVNASGLGNFYGSFTIQC